MLYHLLPLKSELMSTTPIHPNSVTLSAVCGSAGGVGGAANTGLTGTVTINSAGSILTHNGYSAGWSTPVAYQDSTGKTYIQDKNGKRIAVDELLDFVETMKKRFLILEPMFEKHEQYPALKAAYENYLLIERMCFGRRRQDLTPETGGTIIW